MKKKIILLIFIVAIVVAVVAILNLNNNQKQEEGQTYTQLSIEEIFNNMSTTDKIAQMLMPAFRTYNNSNVTSLNDDIKSTLQKYGFAGVILFDENNDTTEQTVRLIDAFQTANAKIR